ncbi:hypothetical protein OFEAOIEE_LOCUS1429 [Methylorubrum extorquens]
MKPQPPVTSMRIDPNSVQFPSVEWTGLRSVAAKPICGRLQSVRHNNLGTLSQNTRPRLARSGAAWSLPERIAAASATGHAMPIAGSFQRRFRSSAGL